MSRGNTAYAPLGTRFYRSHTAERAGVKKPGSPGVTERTSRKKNTSSRKKWNRFFLMLTIILSLLLAGEVCFHLFIAPNLSIRQVQINADANLNLSNDEILALAGIDKYEYYFSLEPEVSQRKLEGFPMIKEARVTKVFPDKLNITVTGRQPLGVILVNVENMTVPSAFDEEGVVFQVGSSVTDTSLPVFSGVKIPSFKLGMKLPEELATTLSDLSSLKRNHPHLFSLLSEIQFVRKKDSRYEMILYPEPYRTKVRVGERIDAELIKYIVMVLDVFEREELEPADELDFRTGEVVFTPYEAGYSVDG